MVDRIMSWGMAILKRYWVTWLLMAVMLSSLIYSIQEAGWIKNNRPLISCLLLGIGFGWLIAKSRFHPAFAAAYAVFISSCFALESLGNILPSLSDLPSRSFWTIVNDMNIRAVSLYLRGTTWIETLQAGKNINDTGLFVLLMGVILSLCGIWWMWSYIRQKRVLLGLLPVGFLFAVNVHLSQQPLFNFIVFLGAGLLLIVRGAFIYQQDEWQRRKVDFPDQLGLEWGAVALTLTLSIILTARLISFFGTSEGWRVISDWVDRTEDQTSDTATRLFSGVHPPPPSLNSKHEVFVNTPNLSDIGKPISQGRETIMWVRTSDPLPAPPGAGSSFPITVVRAHYWRNGIYSAYNGRGWDALKLREDPTPPRVLPKNPSPGRYYLRQDFELNARSSGALFSVNEPVEVSKGVSMRGSQVDNSQLLEGRVARYQVMSEATLVTSNQLINAPVKYPLEIEQTYLSLPDSLPGRVRTLARRIAGGERGPYHKAIAIQNYLRENFKYDLSVPEAPPQSDVVDTFLFDTQSGFCSHYASAMAVMLRAVGVPARVATGYALGEFDAQRGAFRVPESAAHAWVEVYFSGYGWIEFEPTVVRSPINYPDEILPSQETLPEANLNAAAKKQAPVYFIPLVVIGALALLAAPFLLLRVFSSSRQAPAVQIDLLYRRMRRALAWAGLVDRPSMTPDEYLALYASRLQPYIHLSQALQQATSLYREMAFSSRTPDQVKVRIASQLWRNSIRDWLVLWMKASWKRLQGSN